MRSLIVFTVESNRYAIDIDRVERIMQAQSLTPQAGSDEIIDGVMSYQDNVIKIINFRKMIGLEKFETGVVKKFDTLKDGHKKWVEELTNSVTNDVPFTQVTNPHKCGLGIWLDSYRPYDPDIEKIYADLNNVHKAFHEGAIEVHGRKQKSTSEALEWIENDVKKKYEQVINHLDFMQINMDKVALSLQKYLLYKDSGDLFGIKVDDVEDIVHIDDKIIQGSKIDGNMLVIDGVAEINNSLVTIIGKVDINKEVA